MKENTLLNTKHLFFIEIHYLETERLEYAIFIQ